MPRTKTKLTQHRKPEADRKENEIRIRVTAEQKKLFSKTAQRAGLDVSSWLRTLAVQEASKTKGSE